MKRGLSCIVYNVQQHNYYNRILATKRKVLKAEEITVPGSIMHVYIRDKEAVRGLYRVCDSVVV